MTGMGVPCMVRVYGVLSTYAPARKITSRLDIAGTIRKARTFQPLQPPTKEGVLGTPYLQVS